MRRWRSRPTLYAIALLSPPAAAATDEAQLWVTETMSAKASADTSITLDLSQRARRESSDDEQLLGRISVDRKVARGVELGGGFAYVEGKRDEELRLHQQMTVTHGIWTGRTRLEQRFFDNAGQASWRLRERIAAQVPLTADRRWTMVVAGEAFFHLNRARASDRTGLAMVRNQFGIRRALTKAVDVQLLYMRQQTIRDARPDAIAHIPWLTLTARI